MINELTRVARKHFRENGSFRERLNLKGKVAFVPGSSRGIGSEIAQAFARSGAFVIAHGKSHIDKAEAWQRTLIGQSEATSEQFLTLAGDISEPATTSTLLKTIKSEVGELDYLILNVAAGMGLEEGLDYARRVNRDAQMSMVEEAVCLDLLKPGGKIILNTSHVAKGYDPRSPFLHDDPTVTTEKQEKLRQAVEEIRSVTSYELTELQKLLSRRIGDKVAEKIASQFNYLNGLSENQLGLIVQSFAERIDKYERIVACTKQEGEKALLSDKMRTLYWNNGLTFSGISGPYITETLPFNLLAAKKHLPLAVLLYGVATAQDMANAVMQIVKDRHTQTGDFVYVLPEYAPHQNPIQSAFSLAQGFAGLGRRMVLH